MYCINQKKESCYEENGCWCIDLLLIWDPHQIRQVSKDLIQKLLKKHIGIYSYLVSVTEWNNFQGNKNGPTRYVLITLVVQKEDPA